MEALTKTHLLGFQLFFKTSHAIVQSAEAVDAILIFLADFLFLTNLSLFLVRELIWSAKLSMDVRRSPLPFDGKAY